MKPSFFRKLTAFICSILFIPSCGADVLAGTSASADEGNSVTINNPSYLAQYGADNTFSAMDATTPSSGIGAVFACSKKDELLQIVRTQMLLRNTAFNVEYSGADRQSILTTDTFRSFLDEVFAYDDAKDTADADYLSISWTSSSLTVDSESESSAFDFSFAYITTKAEEDTVDAKVVEIVDSLSLGKADTYTKIKTVNDYIVKNVAYDRTLKNKSAYCALTNGSTICRGYVLLAYKMLEWLNVPTKIITGKGNGQAHTWLIVKIDSLWYDLDITWNDTTCSDSFFLKGSKEFYLHKEDAAFKTDSFMKAYPISVNSYIAKAA